MSKEEELEFPAITLTLEDDSELECVVLSIFDVDEFPGQQYVALLPSMYFEDDTDEDGEVYLYRYKELPNDEVDVQNIEDDAEFELVSARFDVILDEEEFNFPFDEE